MSGANEAKFYEIFRIPLALERDPKVSIFGTTLNLARPTESGEAKFIVNFRIRRLLGGSEIPVLH